jgi:hypothetical protein
MTKVAEVFGCGGLYPGLSDTDVFHAGLECEVECVAPSNIKGLPFQAVPDHSLRNNGVEYLSKPMPRKELVDAFEALHKSLKFTGGDPFSSRTSTHVHVNCLNLSMEDARNMILLYALFEECFFLQVKPERRENIHCVPLTETSLPSVYKKDLLGLFKFWSKYTALNLKRLSDLGTMEFRHMHGTGDKEEIETWLMLLENLWTLAHGTKVNANTLNKETVLQWFDAIFSPSKRVMSYRSSLFDVIRNSYLDVKFSI